SNEAVLCATWNRPESQLVRLEVLLGLAGRPLMYVCSGAFPEATEVSGRFAGAPAAGANVPNENMAICDGVPVSVLTKVRAAAFMFVISVELIDCETSKTIPTFRP